MPSANYLRVFDAEMQETSYGSCSSARPASPRVYESAERSPAR
jgi:hypothetical protein